MQDGNGKTQARKVIIVSSVGGELFQYSLFVKVIFV